MEGIAAEVGQKLKSAIKAKLKELGAYVDDELSNYVMVMVTNRRSKAEMDRELLLFLGGNTSTFTSWLQSVWLKLEQVTVSNAGIESKKKGAEKKKKTKKGAKSSSESDEDKKHKKKRKTSNSEMIPKDVKKRKSAKNVSINAVKTELFSDDQETQFSEGKKTNVDIESMDEEQENLVLGTKKQNATDSVEEEDFLNIKEDFESEFLSDNEVLEGNMKSKTSSLDEYPKKITHKSDASEKTSSVHVIDKKHLTKHLKDGSSKPNDKTKDVVDYKLSSNSRSSDNGVVPDKVSGKNSISLQSIADKKVDSGNASKTTSNRRPLIRDRKLKSRSKSPVKTFKSKSRSPSQKKKTKTRQLSSSRSKSPSRSRTRSNSRSKSPSRSQVSKGISTIRIKSKSRSPPTNVGSKFIKICDKSPSVVDARELINRKRAMVLASEQSLNSKDEKLLTKRLRKSVDSTDCVEVESVEKPAASSGSKIIRIKGRERSKENVNVVKRVEDDDDDFDYEKLKNKLDKHQSGDIKFSRFVVRKQEGRRCITVHSTLENNFDTSLSSAANKNDTVNLREIKRTVYMDDKKVEELPDDYEEDGDIVEDIKEKEGKFKLRQSVVNQIAKYIKEEPQISSSVGKVTKIIRPKTQAQSASSTLIRKAVADARKSLHNSKEESLKKKESLENNKNTTYPSEKTNEDKNAAPEQNNSKNDETSQLSEDLANPDEIQPISTKSQSQNNPDGEEKMNTENGSEETRTEMEEEYDPSENMPQFVVTLTGLNSKLFPEDDMESDQLDFYEQVLDDNKLKPKLLERCKYYPNCLAGDQCLFHHPVIPCKMFPSCKYGNNCLYIHPKCKYDTMCTRYDCTFFHSTQRIATPVSARHASAPPVITSQPCKFYYNCVNPMCPFQHPKICRFDRFCTNKNCTFSHTSLSHVSTVSKDKLKWSRPKDNENKPDSVEQKAELDASEEN